MSATRPPCRDCGKTRPLMTDRRCGSCHETHRLAGRPKDMFASINDVLDEPSRLERVAMTVITQPPPASPPTLVPASDWTGRYQACRICGNRDRREVEDGLCTACFTDEYGPSARKAAEARRDARQLWELTRLPTSVIGARVGAHRVTVARWAKEEAWERPHGRPGARQLRGYFGMLKGGGG